MITNTKMPMKMPFTKLISKKIRVKTIVTNEFDDVSVYIDKLEVNLFCLKFRES